MKNSISAAILGAAVTTALIGLSTSPAQAAQLSFKFVFKTSDGDVFDLNLTTEDTLTTINAPSYSNPEWAPPAPSPLGPTVPNPVPAYTFTGYKVLDVTGTENGTNTIIGILPAGSGVFNAPVDGVPTIDKIGHSPSDNLYNPNGGFAPGVLPPGNTAGNFSFGGLVFKVQEGTEIELYQVFTRPDFDSDWKRPGPGYDYGGCPGSCVGAIQVPEPSSTAGLLAIGSFGALGAASTLKRKLKPSKSDKN